MARARGIRTIVDGAHAYGHFPFRCAISIATTTAPACTSGCWRRSAPASSTCAGEHGSLWPLTPANERLRGRHPQVRGDRHAPGRDHYACRGAGFHETIGMPAQGGAAALPAPALGRRGSKTQARFRIHTSFDPAQSGASGPCASRAWTPAVIDDAMGHGADHRHAHRPRRIPGRPGHAEPLHDPRRGRHLRRRDGAAQAGRTPGAGTGRLRRPSPHARRCPAPENGVWSFACLCERPIHG